MLISVLLTLLVVTQVYSDSDPDWNTLQVTWSPENMVGNTFAPFVTKMLSAFGMKGFHELPLTKEDAESARFVAADENGECSGQDFEGKRYYHPDYPAVSLLYDVNGYLAGHQTNFAVDELSKQDGALKWCKKSDMLIKNDIDDKTYYSVTTYVVDPAIICGEGRTKEEFDQSPGGSGQLFIKTKKGLIEAPALQTDVDKDPNWTKGKCFKTMGVHYWFKTSADMNCNKFKPVFLLYNRGKLTGGGHTAIAKLKSERFEHPPSFSFQFFMKEVPECLLKRSDKIGVSTMHFFLNNDKDYQTC